MLTALRRALYHATRLWTLPLQRRFEAALLQRAHRVQIMGFELSIEPAVAVTDHVVSRVQEALELIRRVDPKRFARIRDDLNRFVITSAQNVSAAYFPESRTCYVSANLVNDYSAANIAIAIVHEATHARVDHMGIRLYPDLKSRIERRCMLEEIAFALCLPRSEYPGIESWIAKRRKALYNGR